MKRPSYLQQFPLDEALPLRPGEVTITMSVGQWDAVLSAYYDAGCILLELDENENPVRAYQKAEERAK